MTGPEMTGNDLLRQSIARLRAAGVEDPARDARLLLARALNIPPDRLTLHLPEPVSEAATSALGSLLAAREARQPMAQILGLRLFMGHEFRVTPDTLDPRPETELLVETAISTPFRSMLDLGTGTGCILISALLAMPGAIGLGTDVSDATLAVARDNAARLGLSTRARFARGDWWEPVQGRFDLIVSNPPYIAEAELAALAPEVREWEPRRALTPGGDGLAAYRILAAGALRHLEPGGRLILEIGAGQARPVTGLLTDAGLTAICVYKDLAGHDRVVAAANLAQA